MSCEKAARRLRSVIAKAKRLGISPEEVAELPATKKLLPARSSSSSGTWTTLATILLIVAGGVVLAFLCAPCIGVAKKRT